jgi:hypothetical protein
MVRQAHHERVGGATEKKPFVLNQTSTPFVLSLSKEGTALSTVVIHPSNCPCPRTGWFDRLTTNGLEGTQRKNPVRPELVEGRNGAQHCGHSPFDLPLSKDRMVRQAHHERVGGATEKKPFVLSQTSIPFVLSLSKDGTALRSMDSHISTCPCPRTGWFDKLTTNGL